MTGSRTFEIGAFTFGELTADPVTGKSLSGLGRAILTSGYGGRSASR